MNFNANVNNIHSTSQVWRDPQSFHENLLPLLNIIGPENKLSELDLNKLINKINLIQQGIKKDNSSNRRISSGNLMYKYFAHNFRLILEEIVSDAKKLVERLKELEKQKKDLEEKNAQLKLRNEELNKINGDLLFIFDSYNEKIKEKKLNLENLNKNSQSESLGEKNIQNSIKLKNKTNKTEKPISVQVDGENKRRKFYQLF